MALAEATVVTYLSSASLSPTDLSRKYIQKTGQIYVPQNRWPEVQLGAAKQASAKGTSDLSVFYSSNVGEAAKRVLGAKPQREYKNALIGISVYSAADVAVRQILQFEALPKNWDGYGADAPIISSLEDARKFLRLLAPESLVPKPTLHADGHALLFYNDKGKFLELEFLENGIIGYYAKQGGSEWGGEFLFNGYTLAPGLREIGLKLSEPFTNAKK